MALPQRPFHSRILSLLANSTRNRTHSSLPVANRSPLPICSLNLISSRIHIHLCQGNFHLCQINFRFLPISLRLILYRLTCSLHLTCRLHRLFTKVHLLPTGISPFRSDDRLLPACRNHLLDLHKACRSGNSRLESVHHLPGRIKLEEANSSQLLDLCPLAPQPRPLTGASSAVSFLAMIHKTTPNRQQTTSKPPQLYNRWKISRAQLGHAGKPLNLRSRQLAQSPRQCTVWLALLQTPSTALNNHHNSLNTKGMRIHMLRSQQHMRPSFLAYYHLVCLLYHRRARMAHQSSRHRPVPQRLPIYHRNPTLPAICFLPSCLASLRHRPGCPTLQQLKPTYHRHLYKFLHLLRLRLLHPFLCLRVKACRRS